jgi:hypothetical protein
MAWRITFQDTGEVREMEPIGYHPGKSLYENGRVVEHVPGRPIFDLPRGYELIADENGGPQDAIAIRV